MSQDMDTAEIIDRFNRAFQEHDASQLSDLVADDCVMESVEPAPNGTRYTGGPVCLGFWQTLAEDPNSSFEPEDVVVIGDRAIIRWRYRFGPSDHESIRGVNLMQVSDGKIIEALGYVKSGDAALTDALNSG